MQLTDRDESYYRQCCLDLAFDMGADIVREGGEAKLDLGLPGARKAVVARPVHPEHFWEDTWHALRFAVRRKAG